MKPLRLRIPSGTLDDAEAALARHLPGRDVQLFEYRDGTVLLPPQLLRALQTKFGPGDAIAALERAGLVEGAPVKWREVIEWARVHGDVWAQREAPESEVAAAS